MSYETPLTLLFAAIVVAVLLALLITMVASRWGQPRRPRARRRRRGGKPGAPAAGARFFCVHCAGQFRHTPRTLKAWERGSRRFFCDGCQAARAGEIQEEAPFGASTQAPGEDLDSRR